ncbi:MAG TPA: secretin N-terminal domain-containing protein [Pyrinomonadaceae bacterium]|nr:secretin N-terminal domain-containing protein [Pyrinomonadaceae bacterium]
MKSSITARFSVTCLLFIALLSPTAVLAFGDGKKYFKEGMKHEYAQAWDKAAEAFALAVAENPRNPEYRLHLQRALFNASQMFMKRGTLAAQEKDYEGAFIAFRRAYAFDPVNELAKSEMARMLRLQQESVEKGKSPDKAGDDGKVRMVQTSFPQPQATPPGVVPQKMEVISHLPFPSGVPLQQIVKQLAKDLDLNVLFDTGSRLEGRQVRIDLRNVTPAKALDYIFLQENLFFQKVGPRTILVADGLRRVNFQQLVLRTFYLSNASPKDVKAIITAAIPAQPGRSQTIVLEDAATNSITVRDTSENIRLIGRLIQSLDKDRAEVVMDVAIYEVNKSDLLQFGNQIGTQAQLTRLGGVGAPLVRAGGSDGIIADALGWTGLNFASIALGLPTSALAALQRKENTKLLASTQIHAFNNEDSSARIGQRVPVRTATFAPITNQGGQQQNNNFLGDVYNYEQVGLTLKFKPIVFPNQDVQVAMDIESKDVAGALTQQPVFTERKITGTARIQNNKTLLLASVAQDVETNGRQGIPILGLLPIIGRLFTAPTRDNRQVDIVIAITPRVIRAPAILPEDEDEMATGSLQTPTSGSLEAMIIQEDRDEMLAMARQLPTDSQVQLPDQPVEGPNYVRSDSTVSAAKNVEPASETVAADNTARPESGRVELRPIDTSAKTLDVTQTSLSTPSAERSTDPSAAVPMKTLTVSDEKPAAAETKPASEVLLPAEMPELKRGERARVAVSVNGTSIFRSAVLGLRFDDKRFAVRSVKFGEMFGAESSKIPVAPFINNDGKMFVSLSLPNGGTVLSPSGVLAIVEIEALADGKLELFLEKDVISFLSADGKNVAVKFD